MRNYLDNPITRDYVPEEDAPSKLDALANASEHKLKSLSRGDKVSVNGYVEDSGNKYWELGELSNQEANYMLGYGARDYAGTDEDTKRRLYLYGVKDENSGEQVVDRTLTPMEDYEGVGKIGVARGDLDSSDHRYVPSMHKGSMYGWEPGPEGLDVNRQFMDLPLTHDAATVLEGTRHAMNAGKDSRVSRQLPNGMFEVQTENGSQVVTEEQAKALYGSGKSEYYTDIHKLFSEGEHATPLSDERKVELERMFDNAVRKTREERLLNTKGRYLTMQEYLDKEELKNRLVQEPVELGSLSAKYEASGDISAVNSDDQGTPSYGKYQLNGDTMEAFLSSSEGARLKNAMGGLDKNSPEFQARFKQVMGSQYGEGLAKEQQEFIRKTHYEPVREYADSKGIDTSIPAIQEMLWSQSVQHSGKGNKEIIDTALEGGVDNYVDFVKNMYKARDSYARKYIANPTDIAADRYTKEQNDVLAMLADPSTGASRKKLTAEESLDAFELAVKQKEADEMGTLGRLGNAVDAFQATLYKEAGVDFADWVGELTGIGDLGTEEEKTAMVNKFAGYNDLAMQPAMEEAKKRAKNIYAGLTEDGKEVSMADVAKLVKIGITTPELLGQSLGFVASLFVPVLGWGGKVAKGVKAVDALNKGIGVLQKNAGLLQVAAGNVNDQVDAYKIEHEQDPSVAKVASMMATETLMLGLERMADVSILRSPAALESLKGALGSIPAGMLPKSEKVKLLGKGIKVAAGLTANMGKEAGQEYLQSMGQALNVGLNFDDNGDLVSIAGEGWDVLTAKDVQVDGILGAGLGAGGAVQFAGVGAVGKVVPGVANVVGSMDRFRKSDPEQAKIDAEIDELQKKASTVTSKFYGASEEDMQAVQEALNEAYDGLSNPESRLYGSDMDSTAKMNEARTYIEMLTSVDKEVDVEAVSQALAASTGMSISEVRTEADKAVATGKAVGELKRVGKSVDQVNMEVVNGTRGFLTYYGAIKEAQMVGDSEAEVANYRKLEGFYSSQVVKKQRFEAAFGKMEADIESEIAIRMEEGATRDGAMRELFEKYKKSGKGYAFKYGSEASRQKFTVPYKEVLGNMLYPNSSTMGAYGTYKALSNEVVAMENVMVAISETSAADTEVSTSDVDTLTPSMFEEPDLSQENDISGTQAASGVFDGLEEYEKEGSTDVSTVGTGKQEQDYEELNGTYKIAGKVYTAKYDEQEGKVRFTDAEGSVKLHEVSRVQEWKDNKDKVSFTPEVSEQVNDTEGGVFDGLEEYQEGGTTEVDATEGDSDTGVFDSLEEYEGEVPTEDSYGTVDLTEAEEMNPFAGLEEYEGEVDLTDDVNLEAEFGDSGEYYGDRKEIATLPNNKEAVSTTKNKLKELQQERKDSLAVLPKGATQEEKDILTKAVDEEIAVVEAEVKRLREPTERDLESRIFSVVEKSPLNAENPSVRLDDRDVAIRDLVSVTKTTGLNSVAADALADVAKEYVERIEEVVEKPGTKAEHVGSMKPGYLVMFDEKGNVNPRTALAIRAASVSFLQRNLTELTMPKDVEGIAALLGINEDAVTTEHVMKFMDGGVSLKFAAEEIGSGVVKHLGLDAVDIKTRERLITELGTVAVLALENDFLKDMETTSIAMEDFLPASEVRHKGSVYRVVKAKVDEDSIFDRLEELANEARSYENSFDLELDKVKTYTKTKPEKSRKVEIRRHEFVPATKEHSKAINKLEQTGFSMTSGVSVLEEMFADEQAVADHINGKSDRADDSELSKDTKESNKARDKAIEYAVSSFYAAAKDIGVGKVFFNWFLGRNERLHLDSNTVNPQTDKHLARWLLSGAERVELDSEVVNKFDGKDPQATMFAYGLVQAFDGAIDVKIDKGTKGEPGQEARILAMAKELVGKDRAELMEMAKKADHIGHAALAIANIDKLNSADGKFESDMLVELDGLTNGFAFRNMQFPGKDYETWLPKVGVLLESSELYDMESINESNARGEEDTYISVGKVFAESTVAAVTEFRRKSEQHSNLIEMSDKHGLLKDMSNLDDPATIKFIRDLMKPPVMVFNYGAGIMSIVRAMTQAQIESTIDKLLEKGGDGKYLISDAELASIDSAIPKARSKLTEVSLYSNDPDMVILKNALYSMYGEVFGGPIDSTLNGLFGEQVAVNNKIISASELMYKHFTEVYDEWKKNNPKATEEDKMEALAGMVGDMPGIKGANTEATKNKIVFLKTALEESNGYAQIFSKDKKRYNVPTVNRGYKEPGVAASVLTVLSMDSSVLARTINDSNGFLSVHDGLVLGMADGDVSTDYNKWFFELNKKYSILEEFVNAIGELEKKNPTLTTIVGSGNSAKEVDVRFIREWLEDSQRDFGRRRDEIFNSGSVKVGQIVDRNGTMYESEKGKSKPVKKASKPKKEIPKPSKKQEEAYKARSAFASMSDPEKKVVYKELSRFMDGMDNMPSDIEKFLENC